MSTVLDYNPTATIDRMLGEWRVQCRNCEGDGRLSGPITHGECLSCKGSGSIQPYGGIGDWLKAHEGTEWPSLAWVDRRKQSEPDIGYFMDWELEFHNAAPFSINMYADKKVHIQEHIHALTPEQALLVLEEITEWRWLRDGNGYYAVTRLQGIAGRIISERNTSTELVLAILEEVGA